MLQVLDSVTHYLYRSLVHPTQTWFNELTAGLDFFLVCCIYSAVFLIVAWKTRQPKGWVAPFRELLTPKERFGTFMLNLVKKIPIVSGIMRRKLEKEEIVISKLFDEEFEKSLDSRRANCLPQEGMTNENLKKRIEEWTKKEKALTTTHKISGSIYNEDTDFMEETANFAKDFLYQNPLHLDTFKELMKMESEVIHMTSNLLSPDQKTFGCLTSGGTQSLMLAIETYKTHCKDKTNKPNIVIPCTAHAAFDKGCFYFNVEMRKAKLAPDMRVDLKHLESLIDSNTVMIVGSAPNFPHGIIDDIVELGKIAKKHKVGFHVDACLGGFILAFAEELKMGVPFNFKVDGVTSMSIDHHKYGLAPKGVSCLLFKTKELRSSCIFSYMDWCGGAYATPTMGGSRSGAATAGAWYALNTITRQGYKANAKTIMQTTIRVAAQLRKIPGIEVHGDPRICVISFRSTEFCSYKLSSYLGRERNWDLSSLHRPEGIHISVTIANEGKVNSDLARDIRDGIEAVKQDPKKYKGSTEALYGGTAEIPDTSIREEILKLILQSYLR